MADRNKGHTFTWLHEVDRDIKKGIAKKELGLNIVQREDL